MPDYIRRPDTRTIRNIEPPNPFIEFLKYLSGILVIVFLIYLFWYFRSIVTYLLLAAIISLIFIPVKRFFLQLGLSKLKQVGHTIASFLSILIFIGGIVLIFSTFVPLIIKQANLISSINYEAINTNLQEPIGKLNEFAARYQLQENSEISFVENLMNQARETFGGDKIINFVNSILGFTSSFLVGLFTIVFILFFFLRDEELFENLLLVVAPSKYEEKVKNIYTKSKTYLMRYFVGILIQMLIVGTITTIGMMILGIENALIIGFFAAIVNLIPYVGPAIAAIFGTYVAITTNLEMNFYSQMLPLIGGICIVFVVAQIADNFSQPLIHSNSVKAHPLEVFVIILIGAQINGAIGMIVALPAYTILRVFAKEFLSEFKLVRTLTKDI